MWILRYSGLNFKCHFFQVNMQLHIEYSRITNQFFSQFFQQFKCFNHKCQMPIAHSVFKHRVHSVSAHQVQQHMIEICCKTTQWPYH